MSAQCPAITNNPIWISWDDPYLLSTGYRKITNLLGGPDADLKWLSEFNTTPADKKEVYKAPVYQSNPKYLWFLDSQNMKLKVSENKPETLAIETLTKDCYSNNSGGPGNCKKDCCSGTSTLSECLYDWHSSVNDLVRCSKPGNGFTGLWNNSCDRWAYNEFGVTDPDGNDLSGTFCINMQNKGGHMKSFIGCDCDVNDMCANAEGVSECGEDGNDDTKWNTYSDEERDKVRSEWKFIDELTAVSCCSQPDKAAKAYEQCKYSFDPSAASNKCSPLMQQFCEDHWGDSTTQGCLCQKFLDTSPISAKVANDTFINYVTNPNRTTTYDGLVWQDYISPTVAQNDPGSVAALYYSRYSGKCMGDPNSSPECRDDSKDPFFNSVTQYLTGQVPGSLDQALSWYCQEFSRSDVVGANENNPDNTLLSLCGCHLLPTTGSPVTAAPPLSSGDNSMWDLQGKSQNVSPYYLNIPGSSSCDPICSTPIAIQNYGGLFGGPCTGSSCVMDNITVNIIDSSTGDVNISQVCGNCSEGTCTCYISDVSITEMQSNSGAVNLTQQCGACYTYTDDNISLATPVSCDGVNPVIPPPYNPPSDKQYTIFDWLKDNKKMILIISIIAIFILGFLLFVLIKNSGDKTESGVSGMTIQTSSGKNYWDMYSDEGMM